MLGAAMSDMLNRQFIKQLEEKREFIHYAWNYMQITSLVESRSCGLNQALMMSNTAQKS